MSGAQDPAECSGGKGNIKPEAGFFPAPGFYICMLIYEWRTTSFFTRYEPAAGRQKEAQSCFSRLLDNYIAAQMRNRLVTPDLVMPEVQSGEIIEAAESRDVPDRVASELQFLQIGKIPEG